MDSSRAAAADDSSSLTQRSMRDRTGAKSLDRMVSIAWMLFIRLCPPLKVRITCAAVSGRPHGRDSNLPSPSRSCCTWCRNAVNGSQSSSVLKVLAHCSIFLRSNAWRRSASSRFPPPSFESRIAVAGRAWGGGPPHNLPAGRPRLRPGAFPQHGALELREAPHHRHHHLAGRRRRVDRLGHAPKSRAGFAELLQEREHVAQRAREPIQLPDHHDVPGPQVREELEEVGPVPPSPDAFLTIDARAPNRVQRRHLRRSVLIVRGHAGVPDQYCRTVLPITLIQQYRFAMPGISHLRDRGCACLSIASKTIRESCKPC